MPKMKTNSGSKKRFTLTGTGTWGIMAALRRAELPKSMKTSPSRCLARASIAASVRVSQPRP